MTQNTHQDILARVQKPSRYLGTEINRICKDFESTKLKFALAFPDLYDIGTSHFGIQILYRILNDHEDIVAERVFAPGKDLEALLRQRSERLFSLENRMPLDRFDIIGFSLLYELNYTNVLNMIDLAGLPLKWEQRDDSHSLVIAGGPCVCNPEPMADFFDAMVFGDGEEVIRKMTGQWLRWHNSGGRDKVALLRRWAEIEGVYVPRFYKATYSAKGQQLLEPVNNAPPQVRRVVISDLDSTRFPKRPIIPFGKPVHDRLRLEIARGCTRGCRFCQAGMIYRPVRERSPQKLFDLTQQALEETGYEDLSLLSLSTGDYGCLGSLLEAVMQHCRKDRVAVSLPSLRAGSLTSKLMTLIKSVRKTGFTIAPEAGSQRLRDVINKNISFEDVADTVHDAFSLGWRVIKLYFMIGLPTENQKDLEGIVDMVRRLKQIKGPKGRGQINVSVTTFVPKAHTPFQWAGQISLSESRKRIAFLQSELAKIRGVRLKWQDPNMSQLEGTLARGDRRMAPVLMDAWKNGCIFDGWSDAFDYRLWQESFSRCAIDPEQRNAGVRKHDEPLPWDHMDSGIDPHFFKTQWEEARAGKTIADCRWGSCHQCGVCDFETMNPVVYEHCNLSVPATVSEDAPIERPLTTYGMIYEKMGPARFFGHLELSNLFGRAVRRACLPVAYSQGFHPMPKISFDDPLPLGIESQGERMRIKLYEPIDAKQLVERINPYLPMGVKIVRCQEMAPGERQAPAGADQFLIVLKDYRVDQETLTAFWERDRWDYERIKPKGRRRTLDLRASIARLCSKDGKHIHLEIKEGVPHTIRPLDVLVGVFNLAEDVIHDARITKLTLEPHSDA